ncbi:hypothetical protein PC116_g22019 [Phytophthora cactorum]|uniref:Uncharacterized protein n=1 Tax=Phytophthora cactorum TaxID=29920 RepID=A0A8T1JX61_9STRA|nr:hypothetical protein Pcac1_g4235 [Phytophthora cactorum]KAG2886944.1 hypothetical protein PC114_g19023 [Phytophthora cactorum]KAG2911257.1 hypothetical protein PC117_g19222 [Phytophthora cactorum]KAG2963833.1 hypothetical protein PC119_g25401 [Phytophthora cactorum]KAG3153652.1 hypothetical protein C6341_g15882 [Phytophthora cactorum]
MSAYAGRQGVKKLRRPSGNDRGGPAGRKMAALLLDEAIMRCRRDIVVVLKPTFD